MDHDSSSSGHAECSACPRRRFANVKGKDLIPAMTPAISRPAFVSAHDCDVVAGVANVAIQQELSSMLGNELTHRLHETLRRTDMAAYGTNISLNDCQAYMHSRPLSYFNFISPIGPRIEDSISKAVAGHARISHCWELRFYIPMVGEVGRRIPS
jgi:hypothetical protein